MLSKTLQEAVNEQIKNELYSAYLYARIRTIKVLISHSTFLKKNGLGKRSFLQAARTLNC